MACHCPHLSALKPDNDAHFRQGNLLLHLEKCTPLSNRDYRCNSMKLSHICYRPIPLFVPEIM
jgi:hypothetical protein